jgi:hypothetical protein
MGPNLIIYRIILKILWRCKFIEIEKAITGLGQWLPFNNKRGKVILFNEVCGR